MNPLDPRVRVRRRTWTNSDGCVEELIQIRTFNQFVLVPFDKARGLVDMVHDICDDRDRELREGK
ncbi:hypothetical protein ACR5KS_03570 [Leucobacter sp. W1153]|uniref:hypothetical protein n=1 Tax=Leucobacter sp. W1153 TaxID=3439064 RepID=UPI003F3FB8F5